MAVARQLVAHDGLALEATAAGRIPGHARVHDLDRTVALMATAGLEPVEPCQALVHSADSPDAAPTLPSNVKVRLLQTVHRLFVERSFPVTVFGVAMALQRNPEAVTAMQEAGWEIASHGYRWIDYQSVEEATEREHLQKAIAIHAEVTGERPAGWYLGRCSPQSHRLVAEEGGFAYNADCYSDDLPYWDYSFDEPQLMVPYTLDANDMRFATPQGFNSGQQFFDYLKDTFDVLYAEGSKMMSVGLHCRLAGRPGRTAALARFIDYVAGHDDAWVARRIDIAEHWREKFPAEPL